MASVIQIPHFVSTFLPEQSRAVNHWAVLTIGLLNREYRRIEKELEAKQLCYFHVSLYVVKLIQGISIYTLRCFKPRLL